jgi:mycothiol synthase
VAYARDDDAVRLDMLHRAGFEFTAHTYLELVRNVEARLPSVNLPDGYRVRSFAGEAEIEAYVALHQAVWSQLSRPSTYSVEAHRRVMGQSHYERSLNPVVVAPNGALVAYCIAWADPVNRVAEIEPLGVRPTHARRGLGRAVLIEALHRLQARGMTRVLIYGSDGNAPAVSLYQNTGFTSAHRMKVLARSTGW